jgi:DNA-binding NtrC family response regulator
MAFERVGSSQTITVDVRLIAATNQDLEAMILDGRFREDLYYRLNVISLRTPSLRERKEDLFELAVHFLNEHAGRGARPVTHLDEAAFEALVAYDWPGNVRELENVIERAVVLADGPAITLEDLPAEVRRPEPLRRRSRVATAATAPPVRDGQSRRLRSAIRPTSRTWKGAPAAVAPRPEAVPASDLRAAGDDEFEAYERQRLLDALRDADGNKSSAARLLGMPRSTFFSKLKKHKIIREIDMGPGPSSAHHV